MEETEPVVRTESPGAHNIAAGVIFLVIAVAFGLEATNYELGRAVRMGPGFIPLSLSILLGGLGLAIAITDMLRKTGTSGGAVSWRGILLISISLMIFGAYSRSLGLIPCVFLCTLLTSFASVRNTITSALLNAVALTILCWVVFKLGLEMSLPTFGSVFGQFQVF
ncbi:tripartite tricarboxylate transporter TctB family protein [Agrobacterium pusense]|uniref:tripartite tricarboxylate transporter TctB family protein n=1 Tax=Agrobacterium pusense TaxID=648995 RepID=UPI001C6EA276|nr:tripartite tricarboxylate transporter TctB family protein [Agrobacterium pusense]MBW9060395.1 tripartite tricarboxylate transporter TctB family protein [Agrobacterium pusense]